MHASPQPGPLGLYDPRDERDSCGFGLIAQLDDRPSAELVQRAITALVRMTHRGGIAADGLSGDGCGVLIRKPDAWLRTLADEARIALGTLYAAGLVFLPHDDAAAARVRETVAQVLREVQLAAAGWRVVPVDATACGERARASMPRIEQLFVVPALDIDGSRPTPERFQHTLYLARRRAEQQLHDIGDFYVVSLSAHAIGYKGMVLPDRLAQLYPDLQRAELASSAVVFHQRFSTNSAPRWPLAQPFRLLAHNGEINTISGNRAWAQARAQVWRTPDFDPREFDPVIGTDGSDSQSLDNMLELLQAGGMDLLKAMRILIPPATQSLEYKDADLAAFYDYYAINSEPWDGPAGIVTTDARFAACTLDRNGLRPARWLRTSDRHFMIASEAGVFDVAEADVEAKGKLGPGEMIAADLRDGVVLDSDAIDAINRARAPYKRWLKQGMTYLHSELIDPSLAAEPFDHETLARFQKLFQLTREEREQVLRPLAETEQEAVGSMGDDVPMAALSQQVRPLYDCFRQAFAQVTNPPIDPLREDCVMSLVTQLGPEGNIFDDRAESVHHVMLNSPVLSQRKLRQVLSMQPFASAHRVIDLNFDAEEGLEAALRRICAEAEEAVRGGVIFLLLSDRYPQQDKLMLHALLATGAVHHHLIRVGLRCNANIVVETGTARDPHHFACLIGFGATAVYPYLAYQTLHDLGVRGILKTKLGESMLGQTSQIGRSYRRGVKKGLLKIISKMGISTIGSYRGAQLFEIIGLDREVVEICFDGAAARVGGAGFAALQADAQHLATHAWNANALPEIGGLLKYVPGGEYHLFNPDVVIRLQRAVSTGDWQDWQHYAEAVNERPTAALRDLLQLRAEATPIPLDEVEPVEAIVRRFDSAAMSLGALSPEAHEALAIAMNRLGGRSNSGEGGEDPVRYRSDKVSKIKQIASGRFGVTPEYLVNAEVLQIKVAQGAKPGEGGQLPGHKVNALIARLRYAMPGIGLISPPPHHDIYSIEDLAQLFYDLKQVNPDALVSVKLVSHAGVGTIATGVVKAGADLVTISGHDGGTGASPLSSIRYAGTPWELGLSEARQALLANDLRERVILQTDGGLKSGLDVVKAALLGAESFGFGTAPMIALGCKYLRICHLNNCATGVATQDDALRRDHFTGLPERVENFFRLLAEEVRHWLAQLGVRSLGEIVGRTDLLQQIEIDSVRQRRLDLAPLLASDGLVHGGHCGVPGPAIAAAGLAAELDAQLGEAIAHKRGGEYDFAIRNTDRSIGARLSGAIARAHGDQGMAGAPVTVRFRGVAGQSFGAFHAGGLQFELTGEANDYVGKGMAGGRIVLRPSPDARYVTREAPILGNTCLYGATGGELYAAGRAGERFAVRNSGATAVVEGTGDHCCEYMTGGVVTVLGRTGLNFGAGFTGGLAYVLDLDRDFVDRYNHELIDILRIAGDGMENYRSHLRDLLLAHIAHTDSAWATKIVDEMRDFLGKFWLVKPKAASLEALAENLRRAA